MFVGKGGGPLRSILLGYLVKQTGGSVHLYKAFELRDEPAVRLEVRFLLLQERNELSSVCYESRLGGRLSFTFRAEVRLQLALDVVFLVLVAALARAATWDNLIAAAQEKVLLGILATTVPVDERPKSRR